MSRFIQNSLALVLFLGLSFLCFHLALDNEYWHADDFSYLAHNLRMTETKTALFDSQPPYKFQPLVYGISYYMFHEFKFEPRGYFLVNILLHGLNSFLVYYLVQTLLKDRTVAIVSGILFAFTVGNYGKTVLLLSGFEDLVITMLTLLATTFYFRNELVAGGKIGSPWFGLSLFFFMGSMFTRSTSLSILGVFLAFNYLFRKDTGRRVLSPNFILFLVLAAAALVVKTTVFHYTPPFYAENPGPFRILVYSAKNVMSYLVRMVFPIHVSPLVIKAGPVVQFVYQYATGIRITIALITISYSFFGFIFGNQTIRFFIAWTYITVLPFAFFQFPADWLNIRNLYLASIGFVIVLSAGAVYCSRLIGHHRWRRLVPFVIPVLFVLLSRFIIARLDRSYELNAMKAPTPERRQLIVKRYPWVTIDGDRLRYKADMPADSTGGTKP